MQRKVAQKSTRIPETRETQSRLVHSVVRSSRKKKRKTSGEQTKAGGFKEFGMRSNYAGKSLVVETVSSERGASNLSIFSECGLFDGVTSFHRCRFSHDVPAYLSVKPRDLRFPSKSDLSDDPPFVHIPSEPSDAIMIDANFPSVDFSATCPAFEKIGECKHGLKCRFLGAHAIKVEEADGKSLLKLVMDEDKKPYAAAMETELNSIDPEDLKRLRTHKVIVGGVMHSW